MKKYHFISGLPRSGTTLLTSILNQNPNFYSSITDHVASSTKGLISSIQGAPGFGAEANVQRRRDTVIGMFEGYYKQVQANVVFNTNRTWGGSTHIIDDVFPDAKILMCVRDIPSIINSFELAFRRNPMHVSEMLGGADHTVYDRAERLMHPEGVIGLGYQCLKQAITSAEKYKVMLIEYEQLCNSPEGMMRAIYNFIDEPWYEHDFNNVESSWDEYDAEIGLDLHKIRKAVEPYVRKEFIIPPDIVNKFTGMEVWR